MRRLCALALTMIMVAVTTAGRPPAVASSVIPPVTVTLETRALGSTAMVWLRAHEAADFGQAKGGDIPPWRPNQCGYYSVWRLIADHPYTDPPERRYGILVYDSCTQDESGGDVQVFPVPDQPHDGSCTNSDEHFNTTQYSLCPYVASGVVPADLAFEPHCEALTTASVALHVDVTPPTYDASRAAVLTVATGFSDDVTRLLSEGTCLDVLQWSVRGWTLRWSDGTTDVRAGDGQSGVTVQHTLAPRPAASGVVSSDVDVVAHLHVIGQTYGFRADGTLDPTPVRREGDVDVSNHAASSATPAVVSYVPPQLDAGAVVLVQHGDGTFDVRPSASTPADHAVTLRGRLARVYPQAVVVRPGREEIDGVDVGDATTKTVRWTYAGGSTDAPSAEATPPGASGDPSQPVQVQYDHAERLDGAGRPVDEQVPLRLEVRTTYPDGHTDSAVLDGALALSIDYAALNDQQ